MTALDSMNYFESRQLIVVPVTAHWIGAPNSASLRAESATCGTRIQCMLFLVRLNASKESHYKVVAHFDARWS